MVGRLIYELGNKVLVILRHQEVTTMFSNHINRSRSGFIVGTIAALLFALPAGLFAQSSPLTVVPSTGKVGVNNTNPQSTLDVGGNANVTGEGTRGRESFSTVDADRRSEGKGKKTNPFDYRARWSMGSS
jgi:hypothetical protein